MHQKKNPPGGSFRRHDAVSVYFEIKRMAPGRRWARPPGKAVVFLAIIQDCKKKLEEQYLESSLVIPPTLE